MSISSALVSAGTGLRATARQAEAISSNVANATTPGYGRREVLLAAREYGGTGQGVAVLGVARQVDQFLIGERRLADAANSHASAVARFLQSFEATMGTPDSPWSLTGRINALDTALLQAASRPDSEAALTTAIATMRELATALNGASDHVQSERMAADRAIAERVEALNLGLARIQEMNSSIAGLTAAGRDASALLDKRQVFIDELSSIIPLKEVPRANGTVALISTTGSVLLDGSAARFAFTPVHTIVPEMTRASGALSGLTLNGRPLMLSGPSSAIAGGELAALFTIRDEVAPLGQARLDALARDLIERFGGIDPTIAPGAPGLFTDAGNALLAANEAGLAARITVNPLVNDQAGGATWRLRSGLGAVSPGPAGSADLLLAMSDAISASRPTASAALSTGSRNLPGFAAEILSLVGTARLSAQSAQGFAAAQLAGLSDAVAATGVDPDRELQSLLVVEQSYAANARVLQALDEMMKVILGL